VTRRNLVLIGGGHAHVEVVRRWAARSIPGVALTVLDPNPRPVYSGMVPGFVAGEYRQDEIEIDLEGLCGKAGVIFVQEVAKTVDARERRIHRANGESIPYDVASIDAGSTVVGTDRSGVTDHALASRPIPRLVQSIDGLVRAARSREGAFRVHVVGGGAGGFELAFCLEARLRDEGADPEVVIITTEERLLAGGSRALSRSAARAATRRGIVWIPNERVAALDPGRLRLETDDSLETDAVLWVTGPAVHSFGRDSKLPVDARGFIETTSELLVSGQQDLFAVGDCASLAGTKRAGVYAVRSAPLLDWNLRARLGEGELRSYRPQHDFLSLLNLGDGTAIASKWGLAARSRVFLRSKDRIDRGFMQKYR
jgi:pyridine nucleotide-disulfide oxidoreductase family protein